jgi:hypothetical protein
MLGIITFTSSFIKKALQKDARHVDLLPRMGDVHVAFGILTYCFMQWPSYLLWCTLLSSIFIELFISFNSSVHKVFGHLLGLGSFDSLEGPLAHKHASLPITFGGIRLMSTSTIAPVAYIGSWALVDLVIAFRFMVYQCPFLLEVLTRVDNNTFPQGGMWSSITSSMYMFFSIWTIHWATNGSLQDSISERTIIPFLACFSMRHLRLIVPKFYHVLAQG